MKLLSANIKCIAIICSERMNEHKQVFVNERETQTNKIDITDIFFSFALPCFSFVCHIWSSTNTFNFPYEWVIGCWSCVKWEMGAVAKRVMCHFEGMLESQGNVQSSDRSAACAQIVVFLCPPLWDCLKQVLKVYFPSCFKSCRKLLEARVLGIPQRDVTPDISQREISFFRSLRMLGLFAKHFCCDAFGFFFLEPKSNNY